MLCDAQGGKGTPGPKGDDGDAGDPGPDVSLPPTALTLHLFLSLLIPSWQNSLAGYESHVSIYGRIYSFIFYRSFDSWWYMTIHVSPLSCVSHHPHRTFNTLVFLNMSQCIRVLCSWKCFLKCLCVCTCVRAGACTSVCVSVGKRALSWDSCVYVVVKDTRKWV